MYFKRVCFSRVLLQEAHTLNESKQRKNETQEITDPTPEGVDGISQNESNGKSHGRAVPWAWRAPKGAGTKTQKAMSPRKRVGQKKHMVCLEVWEIY